MFCFIFETKGTDTSPVALPMCKPKVKLRHAACCLNTSRWGRLRLPDLAVHRQRAGERG